VQVDAVKRNCIKVLPHMLVIHLKRFEYDYETMNRWKIKDRSVTSSAHPSLPMAHPLHIRSD
jgi:ubiquitin C-terminal hydrolase